MFLLTQNILILKKKPPLIKGRNTAKNTPGSVRAASCSAPAVICVSGNDLCHSASNWDLTLLLTHILFIAVAVIPLYSRCVCARRHRPAGKKECVDTRRRVEFEFLLTWEQRNWCLLYKDGALLAEFVALRLLFLFVLCCTHLISPYNL